MSDFAIEAHQLVKKFPARAGTGDKPIEGGSAPKSGKKRWQFWKKEPKAMFTAVNGVDLQNQRGEIFGLLGPNGAGKSTTIRLLLSLIHPTSGSARVLGKDVATHGPEIRRDIGYLPSEVFYYEGMKVIDLLKHLPIPAIVLGVAPGTRVPDEYARAFDAARRGRDAAIALVQDATQSGRTLQGWEVDRRCREVIDAAGYGQYFVHRTGHSLGQTVHGNGVHMDDYETHDERRLIPGTGFTIEPGVYTDTFGVRTEINMYVGERDATVTGPMQEEIVTLA